MKSTNIASVKLALVTVLLCGSLAACKPAEPAAPAAEATPPVAAEPAAVTPAPEPMAEPATTPATGTPADATGTPDAPAATEEDDDTPHSGGDKVGT